MKERGLKGGTGGMERRFPVEGGRGWVSVREEGDRAVCLARLDDKGEGLYKAYLLGNGGRLDLGALLPGEEGLALKRNIPLERLRQAGVWPPVGAGVQLVSPARRGTPPPPPPPGWAREPRPQRLMGEELLAQCAGELRGALLRRGEEGFALAVPWVPGREFPLTPLFCFARVEELEGRSFAVFSFNRCGCPCLPHREGGAVEG